MDECEWQRSRKSGCRIAATGKGTSGARNGDPRQNTSKISTNHNKKLEADLKSYSEIGSTHKESETERHSGRCGKDTRPKPLRTQPRHSELQQFQPRSSQCWRGWYQVKDGENTGAKFSNSTPKNPEPVDTRNNDYSRPETADNSGHTQTRHSQLRRDLYQRKEGQTSKAIQAKPTSEDSEDPRLAHWRHLHQGTRPRHHGLRRHLFQGKRGKTTKPQQSNTTPKNLGHVDLKSCTTPKSCQTGEGVRCRCAFRGRRRQSTEACFALRGHPRQSTEAGFARRGRRQKNTEARRSKHKAGEGVRCYRAPKGLRQTCITACSSSQLT